ncbi:segregation and condensation protein A [Legionella micdadei]|uniref:Segregation and condensation protein A n=1 Tax=Legionella micdadei TaxID=451 RepID=A0A098GF28_LEGMI|nr:segregation/condensation protein A [Legionella micdadei]ARG97443.1 segregation/condensation protein A [Legionella micdadei]ARH00248.1 segregation/condensation protein A [Legionella micdadei]KTD28336.1 segregation and condensation protein A [Legionella micdadei]NSL16964.1 segregation/condensation protein A [Legionella micdadei]CEG61074.1 Segregation and condensation protein A [Legionella micdadei]
MNVDVLTPTIPVLAIVDGKPVTEVPPDLFIPPDALEILLESFSGPLDLLLYLIRRQNIDILDIPIAHITQQYMQYIHMMEERRMELAADYLVMAAMLAEIKSRLLLPVNPSQTEEAEEDPRLELVRKLQVYEQFKNAALELDNLPRCDRDVFRFSLPCENMERTVMHPDVEIDSLVEAMRELIKRQSHLVNHQISREPLSVRERMSLVLDRLNRDKTVIFTQLFNRVEGRMGLAVTLLAILELARQSLLVIIQANPYTAIHVQVVNYE